VTESNDNGPFSEIDDAPCPLEDAREINEFLMNVYASYPELSGSDLWQRILTFAAERLSEIELWYVEAYDD
jgi:hypothetical protein